MVRKWLDGWGSGLREIDGAGFDGWESGMRVRKRCKAGWKGE